MIFVKGPPKNHYNATKFLETLHLIKDEDRLFTCDYSRGIGKTKLDQSYNFSLFHQKHEITIFGQNSPKWNSPPKIWES